jgi:hypothetical protein
MNWRRGDDYHIKSDPPGYTITRLYVKDGERFEVWRGRMHISSHDTADEARASADLHAERWEAGAPA